MGLSPIAPGKIGVAEIGIGLAQRSREPIGGAEHGEALNRVADPLCEAVADIYFVTRRTSSA